MLSRRLVRFSVLVLGWGFLRAEPRNASGSEGEAMETPETPSQGPFFKIYVVWGLGFGLRSSGWELGFGAFGRARGFRLAHSVMPGKDSQPTQNSPTTVRPWNASTTIES